jgi:hypothetical protein
MWIEAKSAKALIENAWDPKVGLWQGFPATLPRNHRLPLALKGAASSFVSLCGAKRVGGTLRDWDSVLA